MNFNAKPKVQLHQPLGIPRTLRTSSVSNVKPDFMNNEIIQSKETTTENFFCMSAMALSGSLNKT